MLAAAWIAGRPFRFSALERPGGSSARARKGPFECVPSLHLEPSSNTFGRRGAAGP